MFFYHFFCFVLDHTHPSCIPPHDHINVLQEVNASCRSCRSCRSTRWRCRWNSFLLRGRDFWSEMSHLHHLLKESFTTCLLSHPFCLFVAACYIQITQHQLVCTEDWGSEILKFISLSVRKGLTELKFQVSWDARSVTQSALNPTQQPVKPKSS